MKSLTFIHFPALLALSILNPYLSNALRAQGSLTPPAGVPAATMKTLDQIEPRTPVNATACPGDANNLYIISQPGSYCFTGNLTGVAGKDGIRITADNVSLDLNGFTFSGVAGAAGGIYTAGSITGTNGVTVSNGFIKNWPGIGISTGYGGTVHGLTCSGNGRLQNGTLIGGGMSVSAGSNVEGCNFLENVGFGLNSEPGGVTIVHCAAIGNGAAGFRVNVGTTVQHCSSYGNETGYELAAGGSTVCANCTANHNQTAGFEGSGVLTDCLANNNGTGFAAGSDAKLTRCSASRNVSSGITAGERSLVENCVANTNNVHGISCASYSLVQNCSTTNNFGDGILVTGKCVIRGCLASKNGTAAAGVGIHATAGGNRMEGNETRDNRGHGIKCDAGPESDFILSNTSRANPVNYSPSTGTTFAPVQSLATQTNPSANH